jgi:hypothetical protein
MSTKGRIWRVFTIGLALWAGYTPPAGAQEIVMIDAPYELLDALGEYAELRTQEEQQGRQIDSEMLPVLDTILQEYQTQEQRLREIAPQPSQETQERLNKIQRFIQIFGDERDYRQVVTQYRELVRKQQQLLEQK